jgi:hypothetical protein
MVIWYSWCSFLLRGTFLCGILLGVLVELGYFQLLTELSDIVFGIVCIPFGVLICWGFYHYLKNKWSNSENHKKGDSILLDD